MNVERPIDELIRRLPGLLQPGVSNWLDRFRERYPAAEFADVVAEAFVRTIAVSEFAASVLLRDWPWIAENLDVLERPFDREAVTAFADDIAASGDDMEVVKRRLRLRRNRELFAILWRDLNGAASVEDGIEALSDLADQLLRGAACYAQARFARRFGRVRDDTGAPVELLIIAMGKLGGRELNFSSDIDIIFAYSGGHESDGPRSLDAQSYFNRLSRNIVSLMDEVTEDGFVFRTDTRLRPFGESGPPVISFAALESYLLQHGRDWERYAYVKARLVGPRPAESIRRELLEELVQPFVYRRYLDFGVFESLRDIHVKIVAEVARGDRADDLKLGPGGIREVEFLVQSLQLVRGGSEPELKTPSLLRALERLAETGTMALREVDHLRAAYLWLRRVETLVQAIRDKQVHALPSDESDRARLVYALGYDSWATLRRNYEGHRATVAAQFGAVAFPDRADAVRASDYATLWSSSAAGVKEWQETLEARGIDGAASIASRLVEFRSQAVAQKADNQSRARLDAFVPLMLSHAESLEDMATAVDRCLFVVAEILRRSAYLALLNENPAAAKRLIALCERSAYIAEQIASFPVLLDELLDPAVLRDALSKDDIEAELRLAVNGVDPEDAEALMDAIARFQRATMFRIAVADFSGELPIMKISDSLTFLAEAILGATLELAWRDLERRHGRPRYVADGEGHAAGFGIIAYGKLGGLELSYGSDLDIVFVHDSHGSEQVTDGPKPLDNAVFFNRLVRRLIHFLSTRTRTGVLYEVDTRLRPSGRKGLLVTSLDAFDRYQKENAWTWEHQALLRARAVSGDRSVCEAFGRIRRRTLESRVRRETLRMEVREMREKMRRELDHSGSAEFDLKQGEGGIGDIEFIVQYLVLDRAAEAYEVIEYSDNIRQLDALAACGALSATRASELQEIYRRYRRRQHRLVLNKRPALVPADEFQAERAIVINTWSDVLGA